MASVEESVSTETPSVAQPSAKGATDETENAAKGEGGPSNESSPSADTGVDLGLSRDEGEEGSEEEGGADDGDAKGEDEGDLDWCPEDHIAEEERKLAEERHAKEGKNPEVEALLDDFKFQQLDQLLHRTGLFTQFLSEQMQEIGKQTDAEAQSKNQKGGAGSKRKAAAAGSSSKAGAKKRGKKAGGKAAAAQTEEEEEEDARKAAEAAATNELLPLMNITLRDYQLTGVKWLISLYKNGLNGILADQMGLGKTCQTIGFLSHLREKGINGPFLILGPLSTLPNWVAEIERFCPSMPALLYHGSADERAALRQKHMPKGAKVTSSFPAVVTSYEILLRDVKHLQKYQWKYIIVDEGHRLKNFDCQLLRELRTIPAANKLLLTGTPLQNNLAELWSLLNFILPDVFCSLSDFESWFDFSEVGKEGADKALLAQEQRNNVITKLHSLMKPFMLRRTKADVNIGLPGKMEVVMYAAMTPHQKELNDKLLDRSLLQSLQEKSGTTGSAPSGMTRSLNNLLMQLRKNANHPDLITAGFDPHNITYPTGEELKEQCGKFQLLDRLLQGLFAKGHKVLIFSQMTKMLDLLDHYLDEAGILAARLDGSIKWEDRKQSIHQFNNDPNMKVFLLSTRAGGLGINLTAADTVIIYDSDWNPHQDLQAMDRVHRIGQTKPVLVIRLATSHSVEGKMLTKAGNKMALERVVIKKGAFKADDLEESANPAKDTGSMKADELIELLKADYADGISQSGVVDEKMMERILDRTHITNNAEPPYALEGVGYSVVTNAAGSNVGLLSGVNNKA